MKYTVTHCVFDQQFTGNPFWHSSILLSQWQEAGKVEVVDTWGFYGVPASAKGNYFSKLKIKFGLDIDLSGNHGMICHEEVRFLEAGYGLHGVTFELTEEQFDLLRQRCKTMAEEQEAAIQEIVAAKKIEPALSRFRLYPYEHRAREIFDEEKLRAQQEGREARLKPFDLNLSWSGLGFTFNHSHNCKTQATELLTGVLTTQQINRITENGKHLAVPKYSGTMEQIILHSQGPLCKHIKKSGETVHFRDGHNPEVKVFWSLPPQQIEALDAVTAQLFQISEDYREEVKQIINKLQKIEWLFINVDFSTKYHEPKERLLQKIRQSFEVFSTPLPKASPQRNQGWKFYLSSLFFKPVPHEGRMLLQKIHQARMLLNNLYMAIADGWQIDDDCCFEEVFNASSEIQEYENPLEALANNLPLQAKKRLCSILERPYISSMNEEASEDSIAPPPVNLTLVR